MRCFASKALCAIATVAALAGTAVSQTNIVPILPSPAGDITVSTTWTADATYNLLGRVYVRPGATLCIEAGTVIASSAGVGGSLAVSRGAQIQIKGTACDPVIMTSSADVATWAPSATHPSGGDPTTGTWREAANEWGNLTIMGRGQISENATVGNVPTCNANNVAAMEGLIAAFAGDPNVLYGGGDDTDDSGSISYLSLRYGGRVIGLNNELNGLSLGGIGSDTDIHHLEIMNNVDDGIEIWGGAVNLQYFAIWNIGDDSLDIDQGWRGNAQFGLIVQGYSLNASQGSGVGDNACEIDGAEDSDWQPVTTTDIRNLTVIGQPVDGDGLTAWRDNARVQYHQCIFMDGGETLVRFDDVDGDGANGYGHNGTLTWAQTWNTPYNMVPAHPNDCPPGTYTAQSEGNLAQIADSVMFNNQNSNAYTEANARGVFAAANNNVQEPANSPIQSITRAAPVTRGGRTMVQVTNLDPRPANDALTAANTQPSNGFFVQRGYRGAFDPNYLWTSGWTASEAFGFTPSAPLWQDGDVGTAGANGIPELCVSGELDDSTPNTVIVRGTPGAQCALFIGFTPIAFSILGVNLDFVPAISASLTLDANGEFSFSFTGPPQSGRTLFFKAVCVDAGAPAGIAASNTKFATVP